MVSIKEYSKEDLAAMSLIEIAKLLMSEEKKEMKFGELFANVAALKGLNEEEKSAKISQFYTDLNVHGSFTTNGANMWGLKQWYKKKQEETETAPRVKRVKRRKTVKEEDDFEREFAMINDEIDEYSLDYDEDELDIEMELDEEFEDAFDGEEEEENI